MIEFVVGFFVGLVAGYLIHDRYKKKLDLVMGALKTDKGSMFYEQPKPKEDPKIVYPTPMPIADLPM